MPNLNIEVKNKIAIGDNTKIVCDNSDYIVNFNLDQEWDNFSTKTMRVRYSNNEYTDYVFNGTSCKLPVITDKSAIEIGLYAGNLHTTSGAAYECIGSILGGAGTQIEPAQNIYNQIIQLLDDLDWSTLPHKPFETIGTGLEVNDQGVLFNTGAGGSFNIHELSEAKVISNDDEVPVYMVAENRTKKILWKTIEAQLKTSFDGFYAAIKHNHTVNDITDFPTIPTKTSDLENDSGFITSLDVPAVLYTEQVLTPDQQEQARQNIGAGQSDWNQNDETAPDYVKNRPFYTGNPVETVLVEESTVTFDKNGGLYMAQFPSTFEATVGETYKVSWDGTAYECTCVKFKNDTAIGNLSIVGAGSDTGEPFLVGVRNGKAIQIVTQNTSASHTFSISGFTQEVVKIDAKYLPDTVATKSEVDTKLDEKINASNGKFKNTLSATTSDGTQLYQEGIRVGVLGTGNCIDINKTQINFYNRSGNLGLFMDASSIRNLETPSDDRDAANKKYVDDAVAGIVVPTKTSELTNDSGFITSAQGVENAGKFLVVGNDGNITLKTLEVWQGGNY